MKNGRHAHLAWGEDDVEIHGTTVDETAEAFEKNLPRSVFSYRLNQDVVVIEDMHSENNPSMSVTNDAERVVKYLHETGVLGERLLVYRDTDGRWDQMVHDGKGNFIAFSLLGCLTEEEAVKEVKVISTTKLALKQG